MTEQQRWRTLVIDPPWEYRQRWLQAGKGNALTHDGLAGIFKKGGARGDARAGIRGAAAKYGCMSLADIRALPVADWAEDNAHLYLWTTNAFLRDAFDCMKGWGFDYKTLITWRKTQMGMGMYWRNSTEHVLFGVRGKLKLLRRDLRTDFTAQRGPHSQKPDVFYDLVEMASPGPWIEVFARRQRMGWSVAGDQVYSAIPLLEAK
jgi:N6-adenosine-specific RNA methylase IME4